MVCENSVIQNESHRVNVDQQQQPEEERTTHKIRRWVMFDNGLLQTKMAID